MKIRLFICERAVLAEEKKMRTILIIDDDRDLSDYDNGLHKELEAHWSRKIGTLFDEDKLSYN